ncbi:ribosome maturation factor RimM [Croceimicrobium sp.]|uniref:ribosome maturation factor RimM n=1 Tax=Croceimicrobium sp. TaxID=2828340 RepID=UPI003BAB2FDC
MRIDDCFQLGHISRLHGFKGEVVAVFDTDRPEAYENLESVFLEDRGELIPFFIDESSRNSKGHFILKLEDVDDEPAARQLLGKELWLPLSILPPLEGKNFYFHEVIGFRLMHQGQVIGICEDVLDTSAQPLFKVIDANDKEILIPAIDPFILRISREEQLIEMELPEGLLELYQDNA